MTFKLSELVTPEYNSKVPVHDDPATYEDLYNSLEKLGYIDSITVNIKDGKKIIVGGNQRYTIMCDMAEEQKIPLNEVDVDVLVVEFDQPIEMVANLALNRIHTDTLQEKLRENMAYIESVDAELSNLTGYTEDEINMMMEPVIDDELVVEVPKEFKIVVKLPPEYESYYDFYIQSNGEESLKKEVIKVLLGGGMRLEDKDVKKRN
jgi:hypothetical protein